LHGSQSNFHILYYYLFYIIIIIIILLFIYLFLISESTLVFAIKACHTYRDLQTALSLCEPTCQYLMQKNLVTRRRRRRRRRSQGRRSGDGERKEKDVRLGLN
jgi:energy-converting hydrogenase Eha subunit C